VNHSKLGITAILQVTANPGGGESLQVGVDLTPDGGSWCGLTYTAGFTFGGGTGALLVQVAPGAVFAPVHTYASRAQLELAHRFRLSVIHSGAGSWTYSLSYVLL